MAVVDSELKVQGIENLRIADASVMPSIVSGNTNAAVLAIAERAASLISGESTPRESEQVGRLWDQRRPIEPRDRAERPDDLCVDSVLARKNVRVQGGPEQESHGARINATPLPPFAWNMLPGQTANR